MNENPLGLELDRITARVRDIERATAWYRDTLGFRVGDTGTMLEGRMKYAYLHLPGFGVSLVQLDMPAREVGAGEQLLPCWVHPVFKVADAHRLYESLKARGVAVFTRGPPASQGISTFLLQDSEGNEIEIVTRGGH